MLTWNLLLLPIIVDLFWTPTHRLVIKLTTLLLQLIVTNVESVPAETVVSHSHLVASTSSKLETRVILSLIFHHIELMVVVSSTINFFMVMGSSEYGTI